MKKLDSDTIAEGIDKSIFGQAFKTFMYAVIVVGIIFILLFAYGYYSTWKWEKEHCPEGGCQYASADPNYEEFNMEDWDTRLVPELAVTWEELFTSQVFLCYENGPRQTCDEEDKANLGNCRSLGLRFCYQDTKDKFIHLIKEKER